MIEELKDFVTNHLAKAATFLGEGFALEGDTRALQKANAALLFDQADLKALLPYQQEKDGIFINHHSYGFGFELAPVCGADLSLMHSLAELIKTKVPDKVAAQLMLLKHPYIGSMLDEAYEPYFVKGGIFKTLAEKAIRYHAHASKAGYTNQANIPAAPCDYRLFVFFSAKKKSQNHALLTSLAGSVGSELRIMGFNPYPVHKRLLASLVQVIVTPDNGYYWPDVDSRIDQQNAPINQYCLKENSALVINDRNLEVSLTDDTGNEYQRITVNCGISKYPKEPTPFALWQTPDLFSNLYKVQRNISCPFLITLTLMGKNQDKMATRAKKKAYDLAKSDNAIQNFINPYHKNELQDWTQVSERLAKDEISLVDACYNLMLFTDLNNQKKHIAEAVSNYRDLGFKITPKLCAQWPRFLTALPFMASEGLWPGLNGMGETQSLTNEDIASLAPVVADFKGSRKGVLLPTYRNQVAFLDTFDDAALPISNYNYITCGTPGSGKSHLEQSRIINALARNEQVFIIDVGDSYKHLCQLMGGIYVDATTIALNPFTLFDFEGSVEIDGERVDNCIQIRDLIAIMASPNEALKTIQQDYLLDAVQIAWKRKQNRAKMDDVVDALIALQTTHGNDRRLSDLVTHLKKYTTTGIYGHLFNGETPNFRDNDLVVFELGGLENNKELMKIVMFVMIVIVQGQFYQTSRNKYKRCVIDEAWRYITEDDNPIAARFIVQGFRTARKHKGGFGVITQTPNDLIATAQGRAIKSCASIQHFLLQGDLTTYINQYPDEFNEQQVRLMRSFGNASDQGFADLMVKYEKGYSFHRNFCNPFERILCSTRGDEFNARENYIAAGLSIEQAVECLVTELRVA